MEQQDCVQSSGPEWQGQLSAGAEGHWWVMLGGFLSGTSIIYLGLVTSRLSYWTCQDVKT